MEEMPRARGGKSGGKSVAISSPPWVHYPPSTLMYSASWKLSEPYTLGSIFMEASSHRNYQLLT